MTVVTENSLLIKYETGKWKQVQSMKREKRLKAPLRKLRFWLKLNEEFNGRNCLVFLITNYLKTLTLIYYNLLTMELKS